MIGVEFLRAAFVRTEAEKTSLLAVGSPTIHPRPSLAPAVRLSLSSGQLRQLSLLFRSDEFRLLYRCALLALG